MRFQPHPFGRATAKPDSALIRRPHDRSDDGSLLDKFDTDWAEEGQNGKLARRCTPKLHADHVRAHLARSVVPIVCARPVALPGSQIRYSVRACMAVHGRELYGRSTCLQQRALFRPRIGQWMGKASAHGPMASTWSGLPRDCIVTEVGVAAAAPYSWLCRMWSLINIKPCTLPGGQ
ncbi:hypothetical protein E4U21_000326 [Claviceps maximensis]|nr:hypothetical protein E4U21_000326 [Claviceps maximensis]